MSRGFNQDGGNWSGYVATGLDVNSVSASWTEPAVTCDSTSASFAPWVGIGGYDSTMVEQTGVATDCSSGVAVDRGWYELVPAPPVYYDNFVGPGDSISAEVARVGTRYTLTITDNTRHWTRTVTRSYNGSNASAEFVVEARTAAFPNFGAVTFTDAAVNGRPLSSYQPVALDASSHSGGYEDHTGALSGGTFSVSVRRGATGGA